jgi:hypothetical protein
VSCANQSTVASYSSVSALEWCGSFVQAARYHTSVLKLQASSLAGPFSCYISMELIIIVPVIIIIIILRDSSVGVATGYGLDD